MESLSAYIAADRRQARANGQDLPDRQHGAALFADISGFTPLTEALVEELGLQRGPEELTHFLNAVYDSLIDQVEAFGGSVISFSGDAITCWFDNTPEQPTAAIRAVAAALAMQEAMKPFAAVPTPGGREVSLAVKIAVASGPVRRFEVGDPQVQLIDILAGRTLDRLANAEHQANRGEVVVDEATAAFLGSQVQIAEWRNDHHTNERFALITILNDPPAPTPWPNLSDSTLPDEEVRARLLPPVYRRLRAGQGDFLAELRPAVALFLRFSGIDYDEDPDVIERLDLFVRSIQAILTRYEGYLLQITIGDKGAYVMIAFGAPTAHEDDAVRAASAALDIQAMELPGLSPLQIGISQGYMRVGAYGATTRRTYGALGDEVNLAARLMQAATAGQTLVSEPFCRAAGSAFDWESLQPIRVKGKSAPIKLYELRGARRRRMARLQEPRYLLPMVGRSQELATIGRLIDEAAAGSGQVIAVTGEAGMGKSRLLAEAIRIAAERRFEGLGGECQSYGANDSYHAWEDIWRGFFMLDGGHAVHEQINQLQDAVAAIDPNLLSRLPLLGPILNLPIPDNDLTRSLDAKLRKTALETLLIEVVRARALQPGAPPLLLVLEDCQWLDALSHDLLEAIARVIARLPVLILMAYRPLQAEYLATPRISRLPHFHEIPLDVLTAPEISALIDLKLFQLYDDDIVLPTSLTAQLTNRAEGNPFYVEELLNYLHDRGFDPRRAINAEQIELPSSLHSLILSRIDQLVESQRTLLKVASVIGRLFRVAVIWGVQQSFDQNNIEYDLSALIAQDLIIPEAPEPELAYLFRHVVTQEVAYESLPFATRAALHERIGAFIEEGNSERLDQVIDLLAFHYDRSNNGQKRLRYLLRAGEVAQAEFANLAAIDYFQRVLNRLERGRPERCDVLLRLGGVLELVGRRDEAATCYDEALTLAEERNDGANLARCLMAIGELARKSGQYDAASRQLISARDGFATLNDRANLAQAINLLGTLAAQQGDFATAEQLYAESLGIRRELADLNGVSNALNNLGILARYRGDYQRARELQEESLAMRRLAGNRWGIAASLSNLGNVLTDLGELAEARERLEEAVLIAREIGDRWQIANFLNNLANVVRELGDYQAAGNIYSESMQISYDLNDRWSLAYVLEDMAVLWGMRGDGRRALTLVGVAAILRERINAPHSAVEQAKLDRRMEPVRDLLSEIDQARAFGNGLLLSLEEAIDLARDAQAVGS